MFLVGALLFDAFCFYNFGACYVRMDDKHAFVWFGLMLLTTAVALIHG